MASTPKPPSLLGSSGFTPQTCTSWTPWRTSPPRATSPSTSCFEQARWSSLSAPTSSSPPSQCGAHPTKYWGNAFFTKLDIMAYFHSISLAPPDLKRLHPHWTAYPLVFKYERLTWRWLRLPFGWSWAPAVAQRQMLTLFREDIVGFSNVLALVYYDDVLFVSPYTDELRQATEHCINLLMSRNLAISRHKCQVEPVQALDWLGKRLQHRTVSNTESRTRQLAGMVHGLSSCRDGHTLRRLLGWVSWFASHFPGALRTLQPCYAALFTSLRDGLPWECLWCFSFCVALGCCEVSFDIDTADTSLIYSDALPLRGLSVSATTMAFKASPPPCRPTF